MSIWYWPEHNILVLRNQPSNAKWVVYFEGVRGATPEDQSKLTKIMWNPTYYGLKWIGYL